MMYRCACDTANDKRLIYGVNIMGLCVNKRRRYSTNNNRNAPRTVLIEFGIECDTIGQTAVHY